MGESKQTSILLVFGTRPEAIKMFPLVRALKARADARVITCVTAQHREMLDQVLDIAQIQPDHDLDVMHHQQGLDELTGRLLTGIGAVLDSEKPDRVIVQGDTATAFTGALAAYYRRIPVGHVEAGLRSGDIHNPWPEEVNRKIVGTIADLHFAPTEAAADALRKENVDPDAIFVTGNTVIDALQQTRSRIDEDRSLAASAWDIVESVGDRRLVLVTTHRRENFGEGLANIVEAIAQIARREDVAVVLPVHKNPNVREKVRERLGDSPNVRLIEPVDYPAFIALLSASHFVLTDSGGVQEEAPAFGVPALVMRETTERPEGVEAGTAKLVGTDTARIVSEAEQLLDDADAHARMAKAHNPFGDGHAAEYIADILTGSTRQDPA